MEEGVSESGAVMFDEQYDLRIFDPEKFKQSLTLQQESESFAKSV